MDQHVLSSNRIPWVWFFVIAGALFYIPFIGGVHLFDWDEINFAEISREMMMTGDYLRVQVNYQPFFEKPPFFFWIQSISMHLFGINEFAARLPNALCGIGVLLLLFSTGKKYFDQKMGVLWALSYLGSLLPTLYHKSGIIDPWFNLFIFSSLLAWTEGLRNIKALRWFFISGILAGLAVLTKGPVAPLILGMVILGIRIISFNKKWLTFRGAVLFITGIFLVAGAWFGVEWITHGPDFILAFLKYQAELFTKSVAGHKGFPGYHFAVAMVGIFPASIFALGALRQKQISESDFAWDFRKLMILLTAVVLILFSLVQSKIVHYSSLVYYPVSFLSAWYLYRLSENKLKLKGWILISGILVATILFSALIILPYFGLHKDEFIGRFTFDDFTLASLQANVIWELSDFIPAIFLLILLICVGFYFLNKNINTAILYLFIGMAFLVNIILIFFIGKIEHYTQRSAIEFYQSKEGQNVEIQTLGFHSYAPYFYAKKPVPGNVNSKPHFYVVRNDKRELLEARPELKVLYEKNGFIFLEKK